MGDGWILPKILRETRLARELTLRDAARQAGVSPSTLCRIEADDGRMPDAGSLLLICRWLGVSVEYAMGQEEQRGCSHCAVLERRIRRARAALGLETERADG